MRLLEKIRATNLYRAGLRTFQEMVSPVKQIDSDDYKYVSLGKRTNRDLSTYEQQYVANYVFDQWLKDPLAGRIVEIIVDFIIGSGAKITASADEVQEVIDEFWNDDINNFPEEQIAICTEMTLFGEQLMMPFINPYSGLVRIARLDVNMIKEVLPNPQFPQKPAKVILKDNIVKDAKGQDIRELKVISQSQDPRTDMGGRYDGDVFYFAFGKIAGKRRGHSQMLRTYEWIDLHGKRLFNEAERQELATSYVWDITLTGASDAQIKDFLAQNETPNAGSIRAHSETVKWDVITPDLKAADFTESNRNFLQVILGAYGIPEHFYALGGNVNFATAKAMSEPTQRAFKRQQRTIQSMFEKLIDYQLERAVIAGRITQDQVDEGYEIAMDEISSVDLQTVSTAIVQVAGALQMAETQNWLNKPESAQAFAKIFGQLGTEVEPMREEDLTIPEPIKLATESFRRAYETRKKKK